MTALYRGFQMGHDLAFAEGLRPHRMLWPLSTADPQFHYRTSRNHPSHDSQDRLDRLGTTTKAPDFKLDSVATLLRDLPAGNGFQGVIRPGP